MESLIINNIIASDGGVEGYGMVQIRDVPRDMLAVLQNGARAALKISALSSGILTQLEIDNQLFDINIDANLPRLNTGETMELPVRIVSRNRLQLLPPSVDNTVISSNNRNDAPQTSSVNLDINPLKQLQKIDINPLKLNDVITTKLNELQAPSALKEQVLSVLPRLQVVLSAIGNNGENPAELLQPLYNTLQQMTTAKPEAMPVLQKQLQQNITDLVGHDFGGKITEQINNTFIVKTDLGQSFFSSPLKIQPEEALTFSVHNIIMPQEKAPTLDLVTQLFGLHNDNSLSASAQHRDLPFLTSLINRLPEQNTSVKQPLIDLISTKIPTPDKNMLSNMINFYRAAIQKDASLWLGHDNLQHLSASLKTDITTELNNFVSSAVKDTPLWRIVEIPLYADNNFTPLKVALKKDQSSSPEDNSASVGTRFVVETQFSQLGGFQFDGFVRAPERNLDLVVRTSQAIDEDFCAQIINLFKISLYNLDYKGNIKINQQDNFINFYHNSSPKQGIYI